MFRNIFLSAALIFSVVVFADAHTDAEKTVLKNIEAYWDARNTSDWDKVVAMSSSSGMLNTNSDGSFHKPGRTWSLEDYESNFPVGTSNVYFAEAHKIVNGAYYVRFYYEGVNGENNAPYRTRVTETWIKEMGSWKRKTSHFSSAAYGGVHQTSKSDFED